MRTTADTTVQFAYVHQRVIACGQIASTIDGMFYGIIPTVRNVEEGQIGVKI